MLLPESFVEAMLPYLREYTSIDAFHEYILCCYEACGSRGHRFRQKVRTAIDHKIRKYRRDKYILYNIRRNISLNQGWGDSKTPVSDWLDLSIYAPAAYEMPDDRWK